MSFKVCVSLLIFCLNDPSVDDSEVLKSPTIIVLLQLLTSWLLLFALQFEVLLQLDVCIFSILISFSRIEGFPGDSVIKNPPVMQETQQIWV